MSTEPIGPIEPTSQKEIELAIKSLGRERSLSATDIAFKLNEVRKHGAKLVEFSKLLQELQGRGQSLSKQDKAYLGIVATMLKRCSQDLERVTG